MQRFCSKSNIISIALILSMLCGCASAANTEAVPEEPVTDPEVTAEGNTVTEDEELIEPAGSALSFVNAEIRDLAAVSTYQGVVCPNTYEYSYGLPSAWNMAPTGRFNTFSLFS
ncbi:MAG: hypothetical protein K5673_02245, partial [Lachnospiraceae bacterium]|nr:hypothetical protein [Lachnospiraceae bacterium]